MVIYGTGMPLYTWKYGVYIYICMYVCMYMYYAGV